MKYLRNFLIILAIVSIIGFAWSQQKAKPDILPHFSPPTPTPTFYPLSIPALQQREYQKSSIEKGEQVGAGGNFTSFIISFMVDGLKEYALMNVPNTKMPEGGYPVVIVNHGYIDPHQYNTVSSYKTTGDYFASQGYLVLKPDYRGNANSAVDNDDLKRFAYPIDVMTLLVSLGSVPSANSHRVYLWGHSMGGEVQLEVLEILGAKNSLSRDVRAAVLWAPVTDPIKWFNKSHRPQLVEALTTPSPYVRTIALLGEPTDTSALWKSLSPLSYLQAINTPLQLNHGTADPTVPYAWSEELYQMLQKANKQVTFESYPNADHNLSPSSFTAYQKNVAFFQKYE